MEENKFEEALEIRKKIGNLEDAIVENSKAIAVIKHTLRNNNHYDYITIAITAKGRNVNDSLNITDDDLKNGIIIALEAKNKKLQTSIKELEEAFKNV